MPQRMIRTGEPRPVLPKIVTQTFNGIPYLEVLDKDSKPTHVLQEAHYVRITSDELTPPVRIQEGDEFWVRVIW